MASNNRGATIEIDGELAGEMLDARVSERLIQNIEWHLENLKKIALALNINISDKRTNLGKSHKLFSQQLEKEKQSLQATYIHIGWKAALDSISDSDLYDILEDSVINDPILKDIIAEEIEANEETPDD